MLNQTHKRNQVRKAASFRRKASSTNAPKAPSFFALVSAVVFQQRLIRFLRPQKAFNEEKQTKKQPHSHQLIRQATISNGSICSFTHDEETQSEWRNDTKQRNKRKLHITVSVPLK